MTYLQIKTVKHEHNILNMRLLTASEPTGHIATHYTYKGQQFTRAAIYSTGNLVIIYLIIHNATFRTIKHN